MGGFLGLGDLIIVEIKDKDYALICSTISQHHSKWYSLHCAHTYESHISIYSTYELYLKQGTQISVLTTPHDCPSLKVRKLHRKYTY